MVWGDMQEHERAETASQHTEQRTCLCRRLVQGRPAKRSGMQLLPLIGSVVGCKLRPCMHPPVARSTPPSEQSMKEVWKA